MTRHPCLNHLRRDHYRGIALALRCRKQALGQIRPAGIDGLQERAKELGDFFVQNLRGHFRAEEGILFPLVAKTHPDAVPLIESLSQDHEKIRRNVAGLSSKRNLAKLLFELGDILEKHIRREERELFPLVIGCLIGSEAEQISAEIERLATTSESQ